MYLIPVCDNTIGTLWVIINPNYYLYENGYSTELHDSMGYKAIYYMINYMAMDCSTELQATMCYDYLQK